MFDVLFNNFNPFINLLVGGVLLVFSGNFLVKGGVALARHFNISTLVIGVTVVSFGTSAPELIVSLFAALNGSPSIAMGNVVGSNIANIALVLALTAIILPITVNRNSIRFDWPVMMAATLILYALILIPQGWPSNEINGNNLNNIEGIVLMLMLLSYIFISIRRSKKKKEESVEKPDFAILPAVAMVVISCAGLSFGADGLVNGAKRIAFDLGVSERIVGITIVAFGTSIPELVTSVIAALKKEMDISVGNILGSNIFNIFGILGTTAIVKEISVESQLIKIDFLFVIGISILLFLCMLPLSRPRISRFGGIIMLLFYASYISFIIWKS